MDETFDDIYPNIAWWVQTNSGWIEVGSDEFSSSLVRVLDIGGMLWESDDSYDTVGKALEEADAFIEQWRVEHGQASG